MSKTSLDKSKIKFLLLEGVHQSAVDVLKAAGYTSIEYLTGSLPEAQLKEKIADAHFIGIRSRTQLTEEIFDHAKKLVAVGCFCIGTNQVHLRAARAAGIPVFNAPFSNTRSVAELTLAEIVMLMRGIPAKSEGAHRGAWDKSAANSWEIRGKTLGILGLGRIGLEVAKRAQGFGLELIAHDPYVSAAVAREAGIRLVTTEELFTESDYLTLHVGLTPQTTGIINERTIATMKKGVRILNCARGELIEEAALAAALLSGQVGGAALDVFTIEPPKDSPYFGLPNVILTPHIAGSTDEAQEAIGIQLACQVREYLKLGLLQSDFF